MFKRRIAIIDDDPAFCEELKEILAHDGYEVAAIDNPCRAIERFVQERPDLILIDLKMPEKNGYQLSKEIRLKEEYKDIPIIVLSAFNDQTTKHIAAKLGSIDFFEKPVDIGKLKFRLKDTFRRKKGKGINFLRLLGESIVE